MVASGRWYPGEVRNQIGPQSKVVAIVVMQREETKSTTRDAGVLGGRRRIDTGVDTMMRAWILVGSGRTAVWWDPYASAMTAK